MIDYIALNAQIIDCIKRVRGYGQSIITVVDIRKEKLFLFFVPEQCQNRIHGIPLLQKASAPQLCEMLTEQSFVMISPFCRIRAIGC